MSLNIETRADGRKVCPVDHHSVEFGQSYRELQKEIREAGPVVWSDNHGGFWFVTDYESVRKALLDSETFTLDPVADARDSEGPRDFGPVIPQPDELKASWGTPGLFFFVEGERHNTPKSVLSPPFSKRRLAAKAEMIKSHVDRELDRVLPRGEFDVVHDLAMPVVAGVVSELLGLDLEDPSAVFRALPSATPSPERAMSLSEALAYVGEVVRARKEEPRDDLISLMLQANGGQFSLEEVEGMCMQMLFGALENPQALLAHCIVHLEGRPEMRGQLRADPNQISEFVLEGLRYFNATVTVARTAARDTELGGTQIRKGDRVLLSISAANADPAKYDHPDEFDHERPGRPAQHLGLGGGTHTCLGQHLSIAMVESLLQGLLERVEEYSFDHDQVIGNPDKSQNDLFQRAWMRVDALRTPGE
jgi:cytochrome P450